MIIEYYKVKIASIFKGEFPAWVMMREEEFTVEVGNDDGYERPVSRGEIYEAAWDEFYSNATHTPEMVGFHLISWEKTGDDRDAEAEESRRLFNETKLINAEDA